MGVTATVAHRPVAEAVGLPVDLNAEPSSRAIEIENVGAKRMLSPECGTILPS